MTKLIGFILFVLIAGFVICGLGATRHIDATKISTLQKRSFLLMGPMIPEDILTETGKRYAFWRNVFAALMGAVGILFAIIFRILGM